MILRPGIPAEAGMDPGRMAHIAKLARRWVAQDAAQALVVLVARRGIVVLHEAFGRLTPDSDSPPLARDALFPLASITKVITATAVMVLVEDGMLGLNRPIVEYIAEFAGEGKQAVMVHHLLTHTAGLHPAILGDPVHPALQTADEARHARIDDVLALLCEAPLLRPPGEEMAYCTYGYTLLGEIVRRVSGTSLATCARERIFAPLGMADTSYALPAGRRHRVVRRPRGVDVLDDILESRDYQETPTSDCGVYSTALDMAIFAQMFLNRGRYGTARILSPAAVAEMTRNQIPGIRAQFAEEYFPEASWGLGWSVHGPKKASGDGSLHSPAAFDHIGAGGVSLWVDPVYDVIGIYFSVTQGAWCYDLFANAVMAAVIDV
jgi:CubicO group peptidase (beta-lactamase class C family)